MEGTSMKRYLRIQIKKIEVDKWCEGCRIRNDPGRQYVMSWIDQNAPVFREQYKLSKCKQCVHWQKCGHKLMQECETFEPDAQAEEDVS